LWLVIVIIVVVVVETPGFHTAVLRRHAFSPGDTHFAVGIEHLRATKLIAFVHRDLHKKTKPSFPGSL